ncbi:hypothetical protein CDIK_3533 [Cucumispora dikerogammari]|nr:hypothetical protein CDIK_3533 [Cucumispora dikerogammari]
MKNIKRLKINDSDYLIKLKQTINKELHILFSPNITVGEIQFKDSYPEIFDKNEYMIDDAINNINNDDNKDSDNKKKQLRRDLKSTRSSPVEKTTTEASPDDENSSSAYTQNDNKSQIAADKSDNIESVSAVEPVLVADLINQTCRKLKRYNEKVPLKKISSSVRTQDLQKIFELLKSHYNKRKVLKNFIEFNHLNHIDVYTRRSELIIDEDVFKIGEILKVCRWGIPKPLSSSNTANNKSKKKIKLEVEDQPDNISNTVCISNTKTSSCNKDNSREGFDQIFTENNKLLYTIKGKILKIFPDQVCLLIKNNEEVIKIKALKRKEFIFEKI